VYLSLFKSDTYNGFLDDIQSCDPPAEQLSDNLDEEIQLWVLTPEQDEFLKVATNNFDESLISKDLAYGVSDNLPMRIGALDHPRVAVTAFEGEPYDRIAVTFVMFPTPIDTDDNLDIVATIDCDLSNLADPICEYRGRETINNDDRSFPQPAFDDDGRLYIAYSKVNATGPGIRRYTWDDDNADWILNQEKEFVSSNFDFADASDLLRASDNGNLRFFKIDPTPALAIGTLAGTSEPAVFMAWVTDTNAQNNQHNYAIELAAANSSNLSEWTVLHLVPQLEMPSNPHQWAPALALDTERNTLDLIHYWVEGDPTEQSLFMPALARYRAHDLELLAQLFVPTQPNNQALPLATLPSRNAIDDDFDQLFVGEYLGLDVFDGVAYTGWPIDSLRFNAPSDLATSRIELVCGEDAMP
jgi:hypothetical protein